MATALRHLAPEDVALVLAIGLVLGIFPMWGFPTILCILASLVARVNFPALQIVNQLCWPLQIAMLLPLARLGSKIIAPSNEIAATMAGRLGIAAVQAAAGWCCVCIPLGLLVYFSLRCILRRGCAGNALEGNLPV